MPAREVLHRLVKVRVLTGRYRRTYDQVGPHGSPSYRPPTPEALLPADPVPLLVGLTERVVQTSGAGQFVAEKKLADGADMIYINGDSFIPNARSLEPLFNSRIFAGVQS